MQRYKTEILIGAIFFTVIGLAVFGFRHRWSKMRASPTIVSREEGHVGAGPALIGQVIERDVTPACQTANSKQKAFMPLDPDAVKDLLLGKPEVKTLIAETELCFRKGAQVYLFEPANARRPLINRGLGTIKELRAGGEAIVSVEKRIRGRWSYLIRSCEERCTKIVSQVPADIDGKNNILLDLRDPREPHIWRAPKSSTAFFPEGNIELELPKVVGEIKGKTFTVVNEGPYPFKISILNVMRFLMRAGAAEVNWLYGGAHFLEGRESSERYLQSVESVDILKADELLKEGAVPLLTREIDEADKGLLLAGTRSVPARRLAHAQAFYAPSLDVVARMSVTGAYDISAVPADPKQILIVYGNNKLDWRPLFLIKYLQSKSYSRVYFFRGGVDELIDSKEHGVF